MLFPPKFCEAPPFWRLFLACPPKTAGRSKFDPEAALKNMSKANILAAEGPLLQFNLFYFLYS